MVVGSFLGSDDAVTSSPDDSVLSPGIQSLSNEA